MTSKNEIERRDSAMKKWWFFGTVLSLTIGLLVVSGPVSAVGLKEEVIRELAADLAELSKIAQPKVVARSLPEDWIVGGVVADLEPIWQKAAKNAGFRKYGNIATVNKAFKPTSMVVFPVLLGGPTRSLKVEGVSEQYVAFDFTPAATLTWGEDIVIGYAGRQEVVEDLGEGRIKRILDKINQIVKKYTGKGIIPKGFTIRFPLFSVNFELEKSE